MVNKATRENQKFIRILYKFNDQDESPISTNFADPIYSQLAKI